MLEAVPTWLGNLRCPSRLVIHLDGSVLDRCHPPCCPWSSSKWEEKILWPKCQAPKNTCLGSALVNTSNLGGARIRAPWHGVGPAAGSWGRGWAGRRFKKFSWKPGAPIQSFPSGNDAKAMMVHLHAEGVCTAFSSCLRLEDEFLKA